MFNLNTNIFLKVWEWINEQVGKLNFDGILQSLIDDYVTGLPEVFKWLFGILLGIIVVLGTISLIKKTFKLFIILVIITVVVLLLYKR